MNKPSDFDPYKTIKTYSNDIALEHYKKSQDLFNVKTRFMYKGTSLDPNKKLSTINE